MKFIFRPQTHIAPHLRGHYWIDSDILPQMIIEAGTLKAALWAFKTRTEERYVTITANGLRGKQPMFIDGPNLEPKQIGYVIKAWAEIEEKKVSLEIWVRIDEIRDLNFEEV